MKKVEIWDMKHCENCRFFIKSKTPGNRFGRCTQQRRTVFTRYGCQDVFKPKH